MQDENIVYLCAHMEVIGFDEQLASLCPILELLIIQKEDIMKQMKYYTNDEKRNSFETELIHGACVSRDFKMCRIWR